MCIKGSEVCVCRTKKMHSWMSFDKGPHWRRLRRDCSNWSVAATQQTKKWLALSPRRHQGDVSRQGDNHFTRKSRGRRLDISGSSCNVSSVSLVSSRSWRRRVDVSPVADKISLRDVDATDGDIAEMSPRPAGDWKKSPKESNMFEFPATPRRPGYSPGDVTSQGDVSATSGDSSRHQVAT